MKNSKFAKLLLVFLCLFPLTSNTMGTRKDKAPRPCGAIEYSSSDSESEESSAELTCSDSEDDLLTTDPSEERSSVDDSGFSATAPSTARESDSDSQGSATACSSEETEQDGYDSDSEDEKDYIYEGFKHCTFPETLGKKYIPLCRGIHFSPTHFTVRERRELKRRDLAQDPICASAAYDLAHVPLSSDAASKSIVEKAREIRAQIARLSEEQRDIFQQKYSNQFDVFNNLLGTQGENGIFSRFKSKKNPQVSTSESLIHGLRYASGVKYYGAGVESLDPEYDEHGKPKHPYLGKLSIILVDEEKIDKLIPYFVVWGHANARIKISDHYAKNILIEREVSFPGLVPGKYVVFSVPIRVPSFEGAYHAWYEEKYGLSKRSFDTRKKTLINGKYRANDKRDSAVARAKCVESLIEKAVLPHLAESLMRHIQRECQSKNIVLEYKTLGDGFGKSLPDLTNASSQRELLLKRKSEKK